MPLTPALYFFLHKLHNAIALRFPSRPKKKVATYYGIIEHSAKICGAKATTGEAPMQTFTRAAWPHVRLNDHTLSL